MNPLRQVLQSLKRTSKSWNMVIFPDPRICPSRGLQHNDQIGGASEYRLVMQRDIKLDKYLLDAPFHGGASNARSDKAKTRRRSKEPLETKWIRILDTELRNANGQSVGQILVDILNKFPHYELRSEQEAEDAIRDIESKLSDVASFVDFETKNQTRLRMS